MTYYRSAKIRHPHETLNLPNKPIVFTSGVFDIIHSGHIDFFRKAKEIVAEVGGILVIGVHDDVSVKMHKGESRPFLSQVERINLLSELEAIDFVIPWEGWESIVDLAREIKPNYFAVTKKSYEHSSQGKWESSTWEEIALEVGAEIIHIEIGDSISSSQIAKIIGIE